MIFCKKTIKNNCKNEVENKKYLFYEQIIDF